MPDSDRPKYHVHLIVCPDSTIKISCCRNKVHKFVSFYKTNAQSGTIYSDLLLNLIWLIFDLPINK